MVRRRPWWEAYLAWCRRQGDAPQTQKTDRSWVQIFAVFLEGEGLEDPREATTETIAAFEAHVLTLQSRHRRRYSHSARQRLLIVVKRIYRYLREENLILVDPTRHLKLPRSPRRLPRTILTVLEMRRLLAVPDVASPEGLRDRTILELFYGAGIRFSELADLRQGDVDIEEGVLWVREGKGKKDRVLPLGRWARHWLQRYLQTRIEVPGSPGADRLFLSKRGYRLHDGEVNQKLREYAKAAGIEKHVTTHLIRHTIASLLLRQGADIRQIQKLLGHTRLTSTQIYTHVEIGDLREMQRRCHPREKNPGKG